MLHHLLHRVLLFVAAFGAPGDEGIRNDLFQSISFFVALSLLQKTVDIVVGEPLVRQDGVDVDGVVLGGVFLAIGPGYGDDDQGTENQNALHVLLRIFRLALDSCAVELSDEGIYSNHLMRHLLVVLRINSKELCRFFAAGDQLIAVD